MSHYDDWYNPSCVCNMCITYKKQILMMANEIQDLPANYEWDDTWEFISNLKETGNV